MGYRTYLQGCADYNEHCIYKISKGDVIMKVLITTIGMLLLSTV